MTDKVQKIKEWIQTRKLCTMDEHMAFYNDKAKEDYRLLSEIEEFIKALQEEHVSEDLMEAAKAYSTFKRSDDTEAGCDLNMYGGFIAGAEWQKKHLWKSAAGDGLPEYDREVIVLTQPYPLEDSEFAVSFAHRPNPDGWDGISFITKEIEHYTPKTYGKGGWNIHDVKYWLEVELPKEIEL